MPVDTHVRLAHQLRDQVLAESDRLVEGLQPGGGASGFERPAGRHHALHQRVVDLDRVPVPLGGRFEPAPSVVGAPEPVGGVAEQKAEQQHRHHSGEPAEHGQVDGVDEYPRDHERHRAQTGQQPGPAPERDRSQGDRQGVEHVRGIHDRARGDPEHEHADEQRHDHRDGELGARPEPGEEVAGLVAHDPT
ncbi:MAG TPA: hypothetical protein VFT75_06100 [Nocardioidaceae bacterium]|nr:hypothetical protein [Nocardioidaceae bacterium]